MCDNKRANCKLNEVGWHRPEYLKTSWTKSLKSHVSTQQHISILKAYYFTQKCIFSAKINEEKISALKMLFWAKSICF